MMISYCSFGLRLSNDGWGGGGGGWWQDDCPVSASTIHLSRWRPADNAMHGEEVPLFIQCDGSSDPWICIFTSTVYTVKKRLAIFPSPAGMSLTNPSLAGNNWEIANLFLLCIANQVTAAFSSTRGLNMRKNGKLCATVYSSYNLKNLH